MNSFEHNCRWILWVAALCVVGAVTLATIQLSPLFAGALG